MVINQLKTEYLCDHPTNITSIGGQKHSVGLFGEVGESRDILFSNTQWGCSVSVLSKTSKPLVTVTTWTFLNGHNGFWSFNDKWAIKINSIPVQPEPLLTDEWLWIWLLLWLTQLGPHLQTRYIYKMTKVDLFWTYSIIQALNLLFQHSSRFTQSVWGLSVTMFNLFEVWIQILVQCCNTVCRHVIKRFVDLE